MLGDILAALGVLGFLFLVLMGVWDRYEREAAALGFSGVYEHFLASQAGFADDPQAYRATADAMQLVGDARELVIHEE